MAVDQLKTELRELIVEALALEDVQAEEIEFDAPLFGEGLGLDSIDALELAMAISRRYGVEFDADDGRNREIFSSVSSLAAHIGAHAEVGA